MKRFLGGLLVLGLLVSIGAGLAGRLDELLPFDIPTSIVSQPAVGAPGRLIDAADQDASAAIQQVIQRSNEEQAQAIAAKDASLMSDTVTSDHFQELVQINQDLLDNGILSGQAPAIAQAVGVLRRPTVDDHRDHRWSRSASIDDLGHRGERIVAA